MMCELFCNGMNDATWHQVGWWPDSLACASCKDEWTRLCENNADCVELASWHKVSWICREYMYSDAGRP